MYQNIEKRLAAAQAAIDGAFADTQLQATLIAFGFSMSQLQEGRALRDAALALRQKQKAEYADVTAAKDAYVAARSQAEAEYLRCAQIARFALRSDRSTMQKLDLLTRRHYTQAKRIAQMQQFYMNALIDPAILSQLAAFDLTQGMLEAGQDLVNAIEAGKVAHQQRRGDAKHATKERDKAMAALDRWMHNFQLIARAALKDEPQFLTKLGMSSRQ